MQPTDAQRAWSEYKAEMIETLVEKAEGVLCFGLIIVETIPDFHRDDTITMVPWRNVSGSCCSAKSSNSGYLLISRNDRQGL